MAKHEIHHTLHTFDVELDKLNSLLLSVIDLLASQLQLSLQGLEDQDLQSAEYAIKLMNEIEEHTIGIDVHVLAILARFTPVAYDLRSVVLISKIASQLKIIANQNASFARYVNSLFESSNTVSLTSSRQAGRYILSFLEKFRRLVDEHEINEFSDFISLNQEYETMLSSKLREELIDLIQTTHDDSQVRLAMAVVEFMEFCPNQFRRIMKDVISFWRLSDTDYRHQWVSEAAYYTAQKRGFFPGFDLHDWLQAEKEFFHRN